MISQQCTSKVHCKPLSSYQVPTMKKKEQTTVTNGVMVHRFYNVNRLLKPHWLLHPTSHHSAKFLIVNPPILGQENDQHQEDGRLGK